MNSTAVEKKTKLLISSSFFNNQMLQFSSGKCIKSEFIQILFYKHKRLRLTIVFFTRR